MNAFNDENAIKVEANLTEIVTTVLFWLQYTSVCLCLSFQFKSWEGVCTASHSASLSTSINHYMSYFVLLPWEAFNRCVFFVDLCGRLGIISLISYRMLLLYDDIWCEDMWGFEWFCLQMNFRLLLSVLWDAGEHFSRSYTANCNMYLFGNLEVFPKISILWHLWLFGLLHTILDTILDYFDWQWLTEGLEVPIIAFECSWKLWIQKGCLSIMSISVHTAQSNIL